MRPFARPDELQSGSEFANVYYPLKYSLAMESSRCPRPFGRYQLLDVLGEGGIARVYKAELQGPAGFRKVVALKLIREEVLAAAMDGQQEALIFEARLGGMLRHPNVVDVYELGDVEGTHFIAMEWVDGPTLLDALRDWGLPPTSVTLEILTALAAALSRAHDLHVPGRPAGLVHRDIKPSNILLSWDGEIKLADFGIATHNTGAQQWLNSNEDEQWGTPTFMSPEHARNEPVDGRSDLFSLGLLLFYMVRGELLHQGSDVITNPLGGRTLDQVATLVSKRVDGLGQIAQRCLAPLPDHRYASASALEDDLEHLRNEQGMGRTLKQWIRRNRTTSKSTRKIKPSPTPTAVLPTLPSHTNIPPEQDTFVARQPEMNLLEERFASGVRLLTLKGTGGVGKTRLARHFARKHFKQGEGKAIFVDLSEATTPMDIHHEVGLAVGIKLGEGRDNKQMARDLGQQLSARGPMLIVLDNFEQVIAHGMNTVGSWYAHAENIVFLITSRETLNIPAEVVIDLMPLSNRDGASLFHDRIPLGGPDWSGGTRTAVHRLVSAVDGLPLAIEMLAAQSAEMAPKELLLHLENILNPPEAVTSAPRSRQSTLHDLIDWSWGLLQPWEQEALAQLSAFHGGFTMEAAEAVLDLTTWPDAPWTVDVVGTLMGRSLLFAAKHLSQPRFRLYESVRVFASRKRAQRDPEGHTAHRHSVWYARLGHPDHLHRLLVSDAIETKHLSAERENLLAARSHAITNDDSAAAAACTLAMLEVVNITGPLRPGAELVNPVMAMGGLSPKMRIHLARSKANLLTHLGHLQQAKTLLERCRQLAEDCGDPVERAQSHLQLAGVARQQGEPDVAMHHFETTLQLAADLRDAIGDEAMVILGTALGNTGLLKREQGDATSAQHNLEQALSIHRQANNRRAEGRVLGNLGLLAHENGDMRQAQEHLKNAVDLNRKVGDLRTEAVNIGNLGLVHKSLGQFNDAMKTLQRALKIHQALGNTRSEGVVMGNYAVLLEILGRRQEAIAHLEKAIEICDRAYPTPGGTWRACLAEIRAEEGAYCEARALIQDGRKILEGTHEPELVKLICKAGIVEFHAADRTGATNYLAEARSRAIGPMMGPKTDVGREITKLQDLLNT